MALQGVKGLKGLKGFVTYAWIPKTVTLKGLQQKISNFCDVLHVGKFTKLQDLSLNYNLEKIKGCWNW